MGRLKKIMIALDQLLTVVFLARGQPDETFSSVCWRWELSGKRSWPRRLVDRLFWWDRDHCRTSYEAELRREHLPEELR